MTLNCKKELSDDIIDQMYRYVGDKLFCEDHGGKRVIDVLRQFEPIEISGKKFDAESACGRIALTCLGGNIPEKVEIIKNLKFE